jgi:hypothetical protein
MQNFLDKYYPGIKRKLEHQRIAKLEELLKEAKSDYNKKYNTDHYS